MQIFQYLLATVALAPGIMAQGQFNQPQNSGDVLAALQTVNQGTLDSGNAASAYRVADSSARQTLIDENIFLRADWQAVIFTAQSASGFYTNAGAQAIIDFLNSKLGPQTKTQNAVYARQRTAFIVGGLSPFINSGLLQLRTAVDAASAAVQVKTPASLLQAMTVAFTQIELSYAQVQEIQQFGAVRNY